MLDTYLVAPKTLKRLRSGPSGAFIDDFADALERDGYVITLPSGHTRKSPGSPLGAWSTITGRAFAVWGLRRSSAGTQR